jgi:SPASM domain peptide maturase of grasp-with-spasm system
MNEKFFIFFSCCVIIKGYKRAAIYDLQRGRCCFIPLEMVDIIDLLSNTPYEQAISKYGKDNQSVIMEYVDLFKKKEYGTFIPVSIKKQLLPLSTELSLPYQITHGVLDYSEVYNISDAIKQLESINCRYLEIRFFTKISLTKLKKIIDLFEKSKILNLNVKISFDKKTAVENLEELFYKYQRLSKIEVYNYKSESKQDIRNGVILFYPHKLTSNKQCGIIDKKHFTINNYFYCESIHYNNCLYKKIAIDQKGNIKNCPSMEKSFGNINNTSLKLLVESSDFKSLWNVKKDNIEICKDCEFRYMCSDCRCFIKDKANILSPPSKCKYNPYICKWEGEDNYFPIENCGSFQENIGFILDQEKINQLNKKIWGE